MRKKNIIVWSIVFGVIFALCIVSTVVFTLGKVEFQMTAQIKDINRSRLYTQANTQESVIDTLNTAAEFEIGGNLLIMNFDNQINNMERACPYVKIDRIVRSFPNKITVYYSEREAVALLPVSGVADSYYVVDDGLKVLDYAVYNALDGKYLSQEGYGEYVLPVVDFNEQSFTAEIGDIINNPELNDKLSTFVAGAFSANGVAAALYEDIMMSSTKIKFYTSEHGDYRCKYIVKTNTETKVEIDIYRIEERFFDKVAISWNLFIQEYKDGDALSDIKLEVYVSANKITIADVSNSKDVIFSED